MSGILFNITLLLYGLATVSYVVHLVGRGERSRLAARLGLAGALVLHLGTIGSLCLVGLNPLRDTSGLLSLLALLTAAAYLAATFRWSLGVLGAFIGGVVLALALASRLTLQPVTGLVDKGAMRLLGQVHLTLVALGVTCFTLAAAVAALYLVQEGALRRGRLGALNRRVPAITTLDQLGRWLIYVGFPTFTLAVITGVVWASRLAEGFRVEYAISAVIWLIFAVLIGARLTVGLRGRRAAVMTLAGFGATGVVLLLYVGRQVLGL